MVVGDEFVAESGGVDGEGEEEEEGEMEEAGAAQGGWAAGGNIGGGRRGDGGGLERLGRVFAFSGQDYGSLAQGWRERKIGEEELRA